MEQPDPVWHRNISFVKSGFRIVAGLFLVTGVASDSVIGGLLGAGIFLILAEILGVLEELV